MWQDAFPHPQLSWNDQLVGRAKQQACTISRNCSSPLISISCKKFERTEQMLNGHALWMHTMTASPSPQGAHTLCSNTTIARQEGAGATVSDSADGEHIQLNTDPFPWPPVSELQNKRELLQNNTNIHLYSCCVHQSPQLVRHANTACFRSKKVAGWGGQYQDNSWRMKQEVAHTTVQYYIPCQS